MVGPSKPCSANLHFKDARSFVRLKSPSFSGRTSPAALSRSFAARVAAGLFDVLVPSADKVNFGRRPSASLAPIATAARPSNQSSFM